jgi:hypothetical protein
VLAAIDRQTIRVGRLGVLHVRPGFYIYVGSALGPGGSQRASDGTPGARRTVRSAVAAVGWLAPDGIRR